MHTAKKTKHSLVLILCIIVGLISALYLVMERNTIEKAQNHIENILDYDAVLRANAFEKRSQKDAFDALKEAGVTAFAIYDRTLEKANDAGEIRLLSSQDMSDVSMAVLLNQELLMLHLFLVKKAIIKKFVKIYIIVLVKKRLKNLTRVLVQS